VLVGLVVLAGGLFAYELVVHAWKLLLVMAAVILVGLAVSKARGDA
jgi:hypothetical protein